MSARWLLVAWALAAALPSRALADCRPETAGPRQSFAHPAGEPEPACRDAAPAKDDLRDEEPARPLRSMGIGGMGAGGGIASIGGILWFASLWAETGGTANGVLRNGGLGLAIAGGVLFLAGGTLALIDVATVPAPTRDGRGAQLIVAFRFR